MITQINLHNFKCFEKETIRLSPLSLFTGLNGMGKSSVIQALLVIRQNHDMGLLNQGLALNGELLQVGNCKDLLYQYYTSKEIGIEIIVDHHVSAVWKWNAETDSDYLMLKH